jgi:hypothetical protein
VLVTCDAGALGVPADGHGEHASSSRFEGEWSNDIMHGWGKLEFFKDQSAWQGFLVPEDTDEPDQLHFLKEQEVMRCFEGEFKKGVPTHGRLQAGRGESAGPYAYSGGDFRLPASTMAHASDFSQMMVCRDIRDGAV